MTNGKKLLEGDLIRLTAIEKKDAADFARWYSDMEFLGLMTPMQAYPFSLEEEESFIENQRKDDHSVNFAIRTLDENKIIGNCGLKGINRASANAELGVGIGEKAYWGKGYGTDAVRVLLKYAFWEMNLHRIVLNVFSFNERAIKSYRKLGFQQEGVLREAVFRNGSYQDIVVMSLLRREWES